MCNLDKLTNGLIELYFRLSDHIPEYPNLTHSAEGVPKMGEPAYTMFHSALAVPAAIG